MAMAWPIAYAFLYRHACSFIPGRQIEFLCEAYAAQRSCRRRHRAKPTAGVSWGGVGENPSRPGYFWFRAFGAFSTSFGGYSGKWPMAAAIFYAVSAL
jgi:hypothetical protein